MTLYAIAKDGEIIAQPNDIREVSALVRKLVWDEGRVEVASFDLDRRQWVPICIDRFTMEVAA